MLQFHEFSKFNKFILRKKIIDHCALCLAWSRTPKDEKKNRINDESMENWSALHINGRKVHYREQSLVVATAKIIIMRALGPNPCLAPSSASISKIQNTFGVKSLFYQSKIWNCQWMLSSIVSYLKEKNNNILLKNILLCWIWI